MRSREHAQKGSECVKVGDRNGAIAHYYQAIELDCNQPIWVYASLGNQLLQNGQFETAEEIFQSLTQHASHPSGFVGLAHLAERRQQWQMALACWNDCLARFPHQVQIGWLVGKGYALMGLGHLGDAEQVFQSVNQIYPNQPQGLVGLAQVAQRQQNWQTALDRWSRVVEQFPDNLNSYIQLGKMLINLEQFNQAEEVFKHAQAQWPEALEPLRELARAANRQKKFNLAITYLNHLLQRSPDDSLSRCNKAMILAKQGYLSESTAVVAELLQDERTELFSTEVISLLLANIQFCCIGYSRMEQLQKLYNKVCKLSETQNSSSISLLAAEIQFALRDYEGLSKAVNQLKIQNFVSDKLESLSKVVQKYNSDQFPDYSLPKIFGIGLSKTATTSLSEALNILGFHSIHWTNPHTREVISQEDFFLFDGFSDICIACQFEILYYTFPNSRFIYTNRSLESWQRSIVDHYQTHHEIHHLEELRVQPFRQRNNFFSGWVEMNLYTRHDTWEAAYLDYDRRVKDFFKDKPKEKFLELSICEGEGWEQLCPFLDKEVPDVPFPNKNQSYS